MQNKPTVILYPEVYLLCIILPWQLWLLCIGLYRIIPKALATLILNQRLHYISADGEIILLGSILTQHQFSITLKQQIKLSFISAGFGKSVFIIHSTPKVRDSCT